MHILGMKAYMPLPFLRRTEPPLASTDATSSGVMGRMSLDKTFQYPASVKARLGRTGTPSIRRLSRSDDPLHPLVLSILISNFRRLISAFAASSRCRAATRLLTSRFTHDSDGLVMKPGIFFSDCRVRGNKTKKWRLAPQPRHRSLLS